MFQQLSDAIVAAPALLFYHSLTGRIVGGSEDAAESIPGLVVSLSAMLNLVVIVPLVFAAVRLHGSSARVGLALRACASRELILWTAATVSLFVASIAGGPMRDGSNSFSAESLVATSLYPWLLWLSLVIVVPVVEELVYRGYMMSALLGRGWSPVLVAAASAAVWTTSHSQYSGYDSIVLVALGMVLAYSRLRSGSLIAALVCHSLWNLLALVV